MATQTGTVVRGKGAASQTLRLQAPHFIQYGITGFHLGSINVQLDGPMQRNPTITTNPIKWHPNPNVMLEVYSFTPVEIEYWECTNGGTIDRRTLETVGVSGQWRTVSGWIYDPHNSPNRKLPNYVEIICPHIPIAYGSYVKITV